MVGQLCSTGPRSKREVYKIEKCRLIPCRMLLSTFSGVDTAGRRGARARRESWKQRSARQELSLGSVLPLQSVCLFTTDPLPPPSPSFPLPLVSFSLDIAEFCWFLYDCRERRLERQRHAAVSQFVFKRIANVCLVWNLAFLLTLSFKFCRELWVCCSVVPPLWKTAQHLKYEEFTTASQNTRALRHNLDTIFKI